VIKQASSQSLQRSHLPHLSKHFPSSSHQGGAEVVLNTMILMLAPKCQGMIGADASPSKHMMCSSSEYHCDCAWPMFRLENMQSTFLGTFLPCEDQTKRVIRDCGGAAMHRVTMIDWSQQESSPSTQSCLPFSSRPITVSRANLPRHSATDIWWRFLLDFETALVHILALLPYRPYRHIVKPAFLFSQE